MADQTIAPKYAELVVDLLEIVKDGDTFGVNAKHPTTIDTRNKIEKAATAIADLQAELERAKGALEFYKDPWNHPRRQAKDLSVPDFYSEMDFGETARLALGEPR